MSSCELRTLTFDLFGRLDIGSVQAATMQPFGERATHDFPPTVKIPMELGPELERLAKDLGYPATSPAEIEGRFRALVDGIARKG
jgi:hypothetical protein